MTCSRSGGAFRTVLCTLALVAGAPATATGQPACRGPDSTSSALVSHLQHYTSATDSVTMAVRDSLRLPAGWTPVLITDTRRCQDAVNAMRASVPGYPERLSGRVYLFSIGRTHYAVLDPEWGWNEPSQWFTVVFDARWNRLSMF